MRQTPVICARSPAPVIPSEARDLLLRLARTSRVEIFLLTFYTKRPIVLQSVYRREPEDQWTKPTFYKAPWT